MFLLQLILYILFSEGKTEQSSQLIISPKSSIVKKAIGDNFYAICAGIGAPHPKNFRWIYPSGEEISSEDKRIYGETDGFRGRMYIYNVTAQDAGTYTCIANIGGVDFIKNITLQTYQPIKFLKAPIKQEIIVNTTAKVYCNVIGEPPLEVEWPLIADNTTANERILFQEDGILIKNVEESDEGNYICLATNNELGMMEDRKIRVQVTSPPIWSELPREVTGLIGSTLSLKCIASGKPQPDISFYKNTLKIMPNSVRYFVDIKAGTLTIKDIRKEDEDYYRCEASNSAGHIIADFKIDLLEAPMIKRFENITIVEHDEMKLECLVEGDPQPNIKFFRNNHEITQEQDKTLGKRYQLELQPFSNEIVSGLLNLKNITRTDRGQYTCVASNKAGRGEAFSYVDIQYAPLIDRTIIRDIYYLWPGHSILLICKADSNPSSIFKWYFKERDVSTYVKFYDPFNSISKFQLNDTGRVYGDSDWRCEATNIYGSDIAYFNIRQALKPSEVSNANFLDITPTTITFTLPEKDVLFDYSSPVLNVTHIYAIYRTLHNSQQFNQSLTKSFIIGGSPYIIDQLLPDNQYILNFILTNPVGNGSLSRDYYFKTFKQSPPYPPTILSPPSLDTFTNEIWPSIKTQDVSNKKNVYTIIWKEPLDGGKPIETYEIQWIRGKYNKNFSEFTALENEDVEMKKVNAPANTFSIENLISNSIYKIKLRAINVIGVSDWDTMFLTIPPKMSSLPESLNQYKNEKILNRGVWISLIFMICFMLFILIDVYCYCNKKCGLIMFIVSKMFGDSKKLKGELSSSVMLQNKEPDKNLKNGQISSTNKLFFNSKDNKIRFVNGKLGKEMNKNNLEKTSLVDMNNNTHNCQPPDTLTNAVNERSSMIKGSNQEV